MGDAHFQSTVRWQSYRLEKLSRSLSGSVGRQALILPGAVAKRRAFFSKGCSRELTSVPLAGIDVTVNGPVNTEVPVYGCAMTTTYRCAGKAKTIVPGDVELGGMTVSVTGSSML